MPVGEDFDVKEVEPELLAFNSTPGSKTIETVAAVSRHIYKHHNKQLSNALDVK